MDATAGRNFLFDFFSKSKSKFGKIPAQGDMRMRQKHGVTARNGGDSTLNIKPYHMPRKAQWFIKYRMDSASKKDSIITKMDN